MIALPGTARAETTSPTAFDLDVFHPAPGMQRLFLLDLALRPPAFQPTAQAALHYAHDPLVLSRGDGASGAVVAHRLTTDVAIALGFMNRYQLSIALPVTAYQAGTDPSGYGLAPTRSWGVEDLRLAGKAVIAGNGSAALGGALEVVVPTGERAQFLGSGGLTGSARLFGHVQSAWFRLAVMAGWRFAADEQRLFQLRVGNSLLAGAGVGLRVAHDEAGARRGG